MEDRYICSSMNNSASYSNEKQEDISAEESGWTAYFDDFFSSQKNPNHHAQNSSSFLDDPSSGAGKYPSSMTSQNPVSDAASYVDYWKSSPKFSKKLNFKKTRTREIYFDDSLEDTASSPVNSPKVGSLNMKEMGFNQKTTDDNIGRSMVKGDAFDHHLQLVQTDGMSKDHEMVLQGNIKDDSSNLRKKGMCLVPVSMLANYLG